MSMAMNARHSALSEPTVFHMYLPRTIYVAESAQSPSYPPRARWSQPPR